jgi:hypothetical protein
LYANNSRINSNEKFCMKRSIITVAIGLSLAVFAAQANAQANDVLQISEVGENFNDIVATFNGAPLSVTLTGAADGWTIELPAGFALNVGGPFLVGEPEDPSLFNQILISQPTFILWDSDLSGATSALPNPLTILNAGTGPGGAVDLVLADNAGGAPVPEAASTLSLLGISLAGLRYFARRKAAA